MAVNAGAVAEILDAECSGHRGPPIPTLGKVAGITQPEHQLVPGSRDPLDSPSGVIRFAGKAVTGQGGADHMERVLGLATMVLRVGQRPDHLGKLHHRAGPAVSDEQWTGAWLCAA